MKNKKKIAAEALRQMRSNLPSPVCLFLLQCFSSSFTFIPASSATFSYFSHWRKARLRHVLFHWASRDSFSSGVIRVQPCGRAGPARRWGARASWASPGPGNEPSCCFPCFCPRACPGLHWCEPGLRTAAADPAPCHHMASRRPPSTASACPVT